ncbi:MAG: preprotein translocase subunit SecA [Acidimicrobiales bacterium]
MSVFGKVLRAGESKKVRSLAAIVPSINALEPEIQALSDAELAGKTIEFKERLDKGEDMNDLLVEAYAVAREAAVRTIGQRHFDVQLMGGMALHFGWIAEMKTGEGKTLVSTLPVYLNALGGRGVHVITVNDYLARRDAEWMGQIYRFLGLTVGRVTPEVDDFAAKAAAYRADVTYGTNTEMGFDYLRDNMASQREHMVQREHVYGIVDEVDSILIDEARTPLIISGPSHESTKLYYQFASIVRTLRRDVDYEVDEEKRTAVPTEAGIAKVERQLAVDNLYDSVAVNYVHQLEKALQAKELYHRDKDYLVTDGEVKIVDEFTGRIMEGRRWSDGLHQAVEAKERVRIQEENHTWATITLQNYFRMYDKLAGMTGTAETEAAEFASTYQLHVVPIPTHRPMVRTDFPDLIFKAEHTKFDAVVEDLKERYDRGQPVLVGTASVAKSEELSLLLDKQGIPHHVLNAKHHAQEAEIVAQAGRLHAITVATNMAGRGVDIVLGGNPEGLARNEVRAQGLELDSDEGQERYQSLLVKFKQQCAAEADEVRALGGLYVLGSERHESRRIDNQLRGRSGRQGDPGESRFYLSLEDELMRLFATGAVSWVMDRALPEDVPIEARMVTKAIERAQHTVEGRNAETRKELLKYDEVRNEQRKVIYARRLQIIDGEDLKPHTEALLTATVEQVVANHCPNDFPEEWDLEGLLVELAQYYPTRFTVDDLEAATNVAQLTESILTEALEFYDEREQTFPGGAETAREIERSVLIQIMDQRWREHLVEMDYLNEGIHLRGIAQTDPLVAWQREGFEMFGKLMDSIDDDYLRYVMHVQVLAAPAEDPDYAQAAFVAADDPAAGLGELAQVPAADAHGAPPQAAALPAPSPAAPARPAQSPSAGPAQAGQPGTPPSRGTPNRGGNAGGGAGPRRPPSGPISPTGTRILSGPPPKVGRNEPCWCGSGRKFKVCHGAS